MAGGTGGHIFPALAVANELRKTEAEIHWLGTSLGMEVDLIGKSIFQLHLIDMKGFRGKGIVRKLIMPFLLIKSIFQSINLIRQINPQVVIGFGGYVTLPGGIACRLLGKKLVVHEQNSVAGSANKLLAKLTDNVLQAFPNSLPNAELVGNPVRQEISNLYDFNNKQAIKSASDKIRLLIMGGSLGAEVINQVMPETIGKISKKINIDVWHQTGKNKHQKAQEKYQAEKLEVRVDEFIDSVSDAYLWADIIICRAGALTVSEVSVVGVPAIFIPYPYAIDNHQFMNADWLVSEQAAELIDQKDLNADVLSQVVLGLIEDKGRLNKMSVNLKKLAKPKAAQVVSSICKQLCEEVNPCAA
jgi:UDP-N-acetylglucosamine--N-acetylmuramyl-(pentapeptide) pyrophosphoryl-undecaprenol N-acetylglucosamine transferase